MANVELPDDEPFEELFEEIRKYSFDPFIEFVYRGDMVISDDDTPVGIRYDRDPIVARYEMKVWCVGGREVGYF